MPDLVFNITDCTEATISTPTVGNNVINHMTQGTPYDVSDIQSFDITWSNNCCTDNVVEVAPLYDFSFVPDNVVCSIFTVLGVGFVKYEVNLSGINGAFVSSITGQIQTPSVGTVNTLEYVVETDDTVTITIPLLGSLASLDYDVVITTLYGYQYTLHFYINKNILGNCSVPFGEDRVSELVPFVTYPEVPATIEYVTDDTINLLTLFGDVVDDVPTLLTGIYQVSICEVGEGDVSNCVQNHVFIDCGDLKCFVIRKWAECIESDVMLYYEALGFSNDCTDNLTYDEVCAIYEVLTIKLATEGCYAQEDDCNCQGVRVKANRMLSPTRPRSSVKPDCGCN